MFPLELITMAGGFLVSFLGKMHTAKMEQREMELKLMQAEHHVLQEVRNGPERGWKQFAWTRRVIALTIVFMVFVFPKLMFVMFGDPVIYGWSEEVGGFLWFDPSKIQHWSVLRGNVITPIDTHAAAAVIGLYFGKGR